MNRIAGVSTQQRDMFSFICYEQSEVYLKLRFTFRHEYAYIVSAGNANSLPIRRYVVKSWRISEYATRDS